MQYIRINFHFMNSTDGRYMMPEAEARAFAKQWVEVANSNLGANMQMFLPHGNTTPVLDIPYRYVLTPDPSIPGDDGIYYHIDDEFCFAVKTGRDRNQSDKKIALKYGVHTDSVLNVFVQTHHQDSVGSRTYKADISGISLGTSVKIFSNWNKPVNVWDYRGILNHEVGHSFGLAHTWSGNDGCDDTPRHPNCWNVTPDPPCDSLLSNNMMDYNAHQAAVTPCQIGKMLMLMTRERSLQRNLLIPQWCTLDTSATIIVRDSMRWKGSMDVHGHIVVRSGAILEVGCRISMPENASITVEPGGKLVVLSSGRIHNACGDTWEGIRIQSIKKQTGIVEIKDGAKVENSRHPVLPQS